MGFISIAKLLLVKTQAKIVSQFFSNRSNSRPWNVFQVAFEQPVDTCVEV
jgi:hypothetical protein